MAQDDAAELPDPPGAPELKPRIELNLSQWVLVPLMLLLPVLALLGVFGEKREVREAQAGPLHVSVRYPSVIRYKILDHIEMHVRNHGSVQLDTVIVALDTTYARRFSDVVATPSFDDDFQIPLSQLGAGESRLIRIQLKAERYWRHRGVLHVMAGSDTVRVLFSTLVYP